MNKDTVRQILVILATLATIAINGLANALPINGLQTGEISDSFEVFFVPAGYVFSIWGLIYLGLLAYSVYQALPGQRENSRLRKTGYVYVVSALFNIAWIFLWHYKLFVGTIFAMLGLLACLLVIYLQLGIGKVRPSVGRRWFVNLPFSIYLGWITVATIANFTSLFDYLQWNGWGIAPDVWAVIMLVVAVGVAALMAVSRADVAYLLVLVWAFAGIGVKHAGTQLVAPAAWIATGLVAALVLYSLYRKSRKTS
ncbi:MAG: tryptophan-rich sensory protein [Anaerolineales bacterium]|nr:tryptophan-rich sensory protein [Anaerolineales bacterium]